jgi:hypothetical protein
VGALCAGARFNGADLTYADFSHADVSGADFSLATVFRARFHRVKDDGTTWSNRALALGDDEMMLRGESWKPKLRPRSAGPKST